MKVEAKLPAYPTTACADNWGMDIRTTIATKMMQGLLSHPNNLICYRLGEDNLDFQSKLTDTEIANKAISLAEALIEELNK